MLIIKLSQKFAKWSKPKPKKMMIKESRRSMAAGDDKAAKLSKSQQQLQAKKKIIESQKIQKETIRKLAIVKKQDISLDQYLSAQQLANVYDKQMLYLKGVMSQTRKLVQKQTQKVKKFLYTPLQTVEIDEERQRYRRVKPAYGNYTKQLNERYKIQEFEGKEGLRRVGCLAVKLGMTTMWDYWGHIIPATILQLDRVQVIQIKPPIRNNNFYQIQMGMGQKILKRMKKPMLGHFLKAKVPPKRNLAEFSVSKQCILPVGYMISARHYTPGTFVDVIGKTVGHGFTGTIKKYGFHRQPQTHGNSLTTRVLGSTGGRQDPGRVFKQKKMYGRMGGKINVQKGLPVFKIDVDKNIIYIKGSVPGKPGTIIKIRDTLLKDKSEDNLQLVSFPTFVQQKGIEYARQISMYCGQRDQQEIQAHDNAYIIDDGDDDSSAATSTKESMPEE